MCPTPTPNTDTLPFAVDSKFIPSGYEGDAVGTMAIQMPTTMGDPSCSGMPRAGNGKGTCHTVIYNALAPGTPIGYPTGATAMSWAGVAWQYPINNWGQPPANCVSNCTVSPGYVIPAGAKNVSFYAKGSVGGEVISFWAGVITPGGTSICTDPFAVGTNPNTKVTLTTTYTQYTMPIMGTYSAGVITAFGFSLADQNPGSAGDGGATEAGATDAGATEGGSGYPTVTFYVDDIEWQ
jgi:hypothetical protein